MEVRPLLSKIPLSSVCLVAQSSQRLVQRSCVAAAQAHVCSPACDVAGRDTFPPSCIQSGCMCEEVDIVTRLLFALASGGVPGMLP